MLAFNPSALYHTIFNAFCECVVPSANYFIYLDIFTKGFLTANIFESE